MPTDLSMSASNGIAFLLAAEVVYAVIAAACSSPQTTEINAGSRADTLMKWVWIGVGQSALLIGIAAYIDPKHRMAIVAGGTLAAVIMIASYQHAKTAGLASTEPGTEY